MSQSTYNHKSPLLSLLIFLVIITLTYTLASFFSLVSGIIALGLMDGFNPIEHLQKLQIIMSDTDLAREYRHIILLIQAVNSVTLFGLAPYIFIKYYLKSPYQQIIKFTPIPPIQFFLMAVGIMVIYLPLSGFLVTLNESMVFPESLANLEIWMQEMEVKLKALTNALLYFESPSDYLLTLIVVAVLPAILEEIMFRGAFQNVFYSILKNKHLAIWITAIFFSAFHLQFYGFLPRLALGALFGYLYAGSGSLLPAIIGHFLNNGMMVTIFYISTLMGEPLQMDDMNGDSFTWWQASLSLGAVIAGMTYYFKFSPKHLYKD